MMIVQSNGTWLSMEVRGMVVVGNGGGGNVDWLPFIHDDDENDTTATSDDDDIIDKRQSTEERKKGKKRQQVSDHVYP